MSRYFVRKKDTGDIWWFDTDTKKWFKLSPKEVSASNVPEDVINEMIEAAAKGNLIHETEV